MPLELGDVFLLSTDGINDFLSRKKIKSLLKEIEHSQLDNESLNQQCNNIAKQSLAHQCNDNLSLQLLKIDNLPLPEEEEVLLKVHELPFPPPLETGMVMDGYQIIKELHAIKRTQIYVARNKETDERVILKTPYVNYEDDAFLSNSFCTKNGPEKASYRQLSQLQYVPSIHINPMVPVWIDGTIKKHCLWI